MPPSPPEPQQQPRVGVGVIVRRGSAVLLGQRQGSLGEGAWALPGGHLEWGETPEACAVRETLEETGIPLAAARFVAMQNVVFAGAGAHYVVLFVQGDAPEGVEPQLREPAKCREWRWVEWDALGAQQPLFQPLQQLLEAGFRPHS